jgi:hypothetical protein
MEGYLRCMLKLTSEFSDGERKLLAEAPAFALLPTGEVFVVGQKGWGEQVLRFRPGAALLGRPKFKDGAWFSGRRKVIRTLISSEPESHLEIYGDGRLLDGPRQQNSRELELDTMEGSRPFLWRKQGNYAPAASDGEHWRAERFDPVDFAVREILLASADLLPPSWVSKPHTRSRPSALAERSLASIHR